MVMTVLVTGEKDGTFASERESFLIISDEIFSQDHASHRGRLIFFEYFSNIYYFARDLIQQDQTQPGMGMNG